MVSPRIWLMLAVAGVATSSALGSPPPSLPSGAVAALKLAGPLAVAPDGALYVYDEARHEVLVRTPGGTFRVVAGNGKPGFAGDGGAAAEAELSTVTDMTFGPGGALYLADGGRVRRIDQTGTIGTVAAALSPPLALAFSPAGELYVATSTKLLRLTARRTLATVPAVLRSGPVRGPLTGFGQIEFGRNGDIYASSGVRGWSLYEIHPNGIAVYRGYARRSGGALASLAVTPGGIVEAGDGSNLLALDASRLTTAYRFDSVPGTNWFTLTYFAIAPGGAIYADDIGTSGFQPYQQLIEVSHDRIEQLWRRRIRN